MSADSLIPEPENPHSFNRFSYVYENPVNFVDPTGHSANVLNDYELDQILIQSTINLFLKKGCELRLRINDVFLSGEAIY